MSQRKIIRDRRQKKKQQQRMVTLMIVAGFALIAVAVIMVPTIMRSVQPVGDFVEPGQKPRPMENGNTMGDPNAPVIIEEFSDFGCGHCADFALETSEQIVEEFVETGQVYFISRSAGDFNQTSSDLAAEAAYCAADQNRYWDYKDIVFANQGILFFSGINYINNYLLAFAETLDLDMKAFEDCLEDSHNRDRVLEDGVDAQANGINSTPSFLINGSLVRGNIPYEEFKIRIEGALTAAKQ